MNPMHPILRPSQCSTYSTLAGATDPNRTRARPSGKENHNPNQQGCSWVLVPTKPLTPSPSTAIHWPKQMVEFLCATTKNHGVRFLDIEKRKKACILHPDEPAFAVAPGTSTVEFRILWPGYEHLGYSTRITILHRDGRPATRWELAQEIINAYNAFLERARRSYFACDDPTWRVSSESFTSADMKLLSVNNSDGHRAVFQADVGVASRR